LANWELVLLDYAAKAAALLPHSKKGGCRKL